MSFYTEPFTSDQIDDLSKTLFSLIDTTSEVVSVSFVNATPYWFKLANREGLPVSYIGPNTKGNDNFTIVVKDVIRIERDLSLDPIKLNDSIPRLLVRFNTTYAQGVGLTDYNTATAPPTGVENVNLSGSLPPGNNKIGNVGIQGALPAGTNTIGKVGIDGDVNIGNLDPDSHLFTINPQSGNFEALRQSPGGVLRVVEYPQATGNTQEMAVSPAKQTVNGAIHIIQANPANTGNIRYGTGNAGAHWLTPGMQVVFYGNVTLYADTNQTLSITTFQ